MKKILLGILVAIIIGAITGGGIYLFQKGNTVSPLPEKQATETKKLPSTSLKEYVDPSGFSFQYPENLSIKNNVADDDTVYADILLTAAGLDGSLSMRIADTKMKSVEEWLKLPPGMPGEPVDRSAYKDAKLGALAAKEAKNDNGIMLIAIDQGVSFSVNASLANNKDFWQSAYDKIVSTFAFAQPESGSAASSGSSGSSDVIFEGEEVVE